VDDDFKISSIVENFHLDDRNLIIPGLHPPEQVFNLFIQHKDIHVFPANRLFIVHFTPPPFPPTSLFREAGDKGSEQ
jgi:hypothetical protein